MEISSTQKPEFTFFPAKHSAKGAVKKAPQKNADPLWKQKGSAFLGIEAVDNLFQLKKRITTTAGEKLLFSSTDY